MQDEKTVAENFNTGMRGTLADFEIVSLAETPVREFYPAK